jgi:hypothetical protein
MENENWRDRNWQWVALVAGIVLIVVYLNRVRLVAWLPSVASDLQ